MLDNATKNFGHMLAVEMWMDRKHVPLSESWRERLLRDGLAEIDTEGRMRLTLEGGKYEKHILMLRGQW